MCYLPSRCAQDGTLCRRTPQQPRRAECRRPAPTARARRGTNPHGAGGVGGAVRAEPRRAARAPRPASRPVVCPSHSRIGGWVVVTASSAQSDAAGGRLGASDV